MNDGSSVYDTKRRLGTFKQSFVYDPNDQINVSYWKRRIEEVLKKHSRPPDGPLYGMDIEEEKSNHEGYYFYLSHVTKDVEQIRKIFMSEIRECEVKHELCEHSRDANRLSMVHRFRTWIIVTPKMQKRLEWNRAIQAWMRNRVDICLLLLFVIGAVFFFTLLDQHWEGYERPWRNLATFLYRNTGHPTDIPNEL